MFVGILCICAHLLIFPWKYLFPASMIASFMLVKKGTNDENVSFNIHGIPIWSCEKLPSRGKKVLHRIYDISEALVPDKISVQDTKTHT